MSTHPNDTLEITDISGNKKQIWSRDPLSLRIRKRIVYDSDKNPTEIWIHDYDTLRTKKIIITWSNGNPVDIQDEIVTIADWKTKWGTEP